MPYHLAIPPDSIDYQSKKGGIWDSNPCMSDPQTDVLTKLHQYRHIKLSRDSRNRTHNDGFGDRSYTV